MNRNDESQHLSKSSMLVRSIQNLTARKCQNAKALLMVLFMEVLHVETGSGQVPLSIRCLYCRIISLCKATLGVHIQHQRNFGSVLAQLHLAQKPNERMTKV